MTLRALWTYDHVVNPTSFSATTSSGYVANSPYTQQSGNPGALITRNGTSGSSFAANTGATAGYLMVVNSTTVSNGLVVALADIPILQAGVTKAYVGFRTIASTVLTPSTVGVFGVAPTALAQPTPLVTEAQLARTVNVGQYVEVFLDIGNNVYSVWVDSIQIVNQAALPTGWSYLVFGASNTASSAGNQGFRDFYFVDVDGVSPQTRLGGIQSQVATITAATAPNYASSDSKTPLADLTTAYSGAPTMTPNLTNAPTNDPLTVTFQSGAPAGSNVFAVQYKLAASVLPAGKMGVALSNGSQTVTPNDYAFNDTGLNYGRDVSGIQLKDPSGNAWTAAGFAATQLTLTPKSST